MSVRSSSGSRGAGGGALRRPASTSAGNSAVTLQLGVDRVDALAQLLGGDPAGRRQRTRTTRLLGMGRRLASGVLILLPPSEGKTAPRRGKPARPRRPRPPRPSPRAREQVLDALVALCTGDPAQRPRRCSTCRGPRRDLVDLDARVRTVPHRAGRRGLHRGALRGARPAGCSTAARRRASSRLGWRHLVALRPGPRRPTGSRRTGSPATRPCPGWAASPAHWREHLGPAVADALGDGLLVDLRSSTYAAFWRPPAELARRVATVRVLHEVDGRRQVVSHFNKATKGRLVRALLEDGAQPPHPGPAGRRPRPTSAGTSRSATPVPAAPRSTWSSARCERRAHQGEAARSEAVAAGGRAL